MHATDVTLAACNLSDTSRPPLCTTRQITAPCNRPTPVRARAPYGPGVRWGVAGTRAERVPCSRRRGLVSRWWRPAAAPYAEDLTDCDTALLAGDSTDAWLTALLRLVDDAALRAHLAARDRWPGRRRRQLTPQARAGPPSGGRLLTSLRETDDVVR
jgi:hypothetical protein